MAREYGNAGQGTIDRIVELEKSKRGKSRSFQQSDFIIPWNKIILSCLLGFMASWFSTPAVAWSVTGFCLVLSFLTTSRTKVEMEDESLAHLEAWIKHDFEFVKNGGSLDETRFDDTEKMWALGGVGEMRTSCYLVKGLPDSFTVVNDITLKKNGTTSANIDHLILHPSGVLMVDTKIWSEAPYAVSSDNGSIIPKESPHWDAVSTCVYEASFLPHTPQAIIFAVGGRGSQRLKNQTLHINKFYDRYTKELREAPCPVYFVPQSEISLVVSELSRKLDPSNMLTISDISTNPYMEIC